MHHMYGTHYVSKKKSENRFVQSFDKFDLKMRYRMWMKKKLLKKKLIDKHKMVNKKKKELAYP